MDYKYIEQLLERYWSCETTTEEETLLRDFYKQANLPDNLERYRNLFEFQNEQAEICLGEDFDEKVLNKIDETVVKAKHNKLVYRLYPFYRAAAIVAVVFTLGLAVQHSFSRGDDSDGGTYNYASYKDTYTDPQVAYEQVASALKEVSDGLRNAGLQTEDSLNIQK